MNQPEKADELVEPAPQIGEVEGTHLDPKSSPQVAPPTAQPVIPTDAELPEYPAAEIEELFGRPITPGLLAAMANAPPGAHASVVVRVMNDAEIGIMVQADTSFSGGEAIRIFCRHDSDGALVVENWNIRLHWLRLESGEWVRVNPDVNGTELLTNQIRALREAGVARIWSVATRRPDEDRNKEQVGYCVWPKLGYDAPIPESSWAILPQHLRDQVLANKVGSPHAQSILALVGTSEGEEWWKENGVHLDECVFDLRDESVSMKVLTAYLVSRQT